MSQFSFYWHDYETFGANTARDRPSQFAGIRTDADFNIIGDPLVIYCKPAADMLPQPEACLITGITPQLALEKGVNEAEFIRQIHSEFSEPQTCALGYNSVRFDDEVSRYALYRNFYDPYAREWQNGNSRWDIIDMVRMCRALRPEGIVWPNHEDGSPSFKLEHLTAANNIAHDAAHDALSDVYATIAMAKLVKEKQPRLFDYLLALRNKNEVAKLLNVAEKKPVLHSSAMFSSERFCTTLVMPLAIHPTNKNAIISYDLTIDPKPLLDLNAEQIKERLYTPAAQLPEGTPRIAIKTIHSNRCPALVNSKLLDDSLAEKLKIDLPAAREHYRQLKAAVGLSEKIVKVFSESNFPPQSDPDVMLYSGGFFSKNDRETMAQVRSATPDELRDNRFHFEDKRLPEMLFRYRARNYSDSLTEEERAQWEEFCYQRLTDSAVDLDADPDAEADVNPASQRSAYITMDEMLEKVNLLLADDLLSDRDRDILQQLLDYSDMLLS